MIEKTVSGKKRRNQELDFDIINYFSDHLDVLQKTKSSESHAITIVGKKVADVIDQGGTVFWCGNGGSAADSQHLAAEFVGKFKNDRRPLRSIALSTDSSILTCISNDYSFDNVFSRQISALGRSNDLLIGISTSGESLNVINAIKAAKDCGMHTVGLTGGDGGTLKDIAEHSIVVPSASTARIQEMHILIGHIICDIVELLLELRN